MKINFDIIKNDQQLLATDNRTMTAVAAAKSLQSCPTLCHPIDGSPSGSPVPGILQARTLEWVAISFSNAWKWNVKVKSLSCVWLLAIPWTAAYQAPPSMGFSRQEYWSGLPLPSPSNFFKSPLFMKRDQKRLKKSNSQMTLSLNLYGQKSSKTLWGRMCGQTIPGHQIRAWSAAAQWHKGRESWTPKDHAPYGTQE